MTERGLGRIDELVRIARQETRTIVGLMSGTSLDGVDAALCEVGGSGPGTRVRLLGFETYPFPPGLRARIHAALQGSVADVCALNFVLGDVFAEAALSIAAKGVGIEAVDVIASHGQTVYHVPRHGEGPLEPSTLQLGEASVIAERTGRVVVSDFRTRDVAAGGGGAPLVAYLDHCLFARPGRTTLLQNIGGIANVTVVTERAEDVLAFDTGPGNVLIDEVCRELLDDDEGFDRDGAYSQLGEVDADLLERLCADEYLLRAPPKTTGREWFGAHYARRLIDGYDPQRLVDLLATVVQLTATSIARSYRAFVYPRVGAVDDVIVSGGGVHNRTLMAALARELEPDGVSVRSFDALELGFSADAKEAVAFAVLANETVQGRPSNLPAATGAARPVLLGKIVL